MVAKKNKGKHRVKKTKATAVGSAQGNAKPKSKAKSTKEKKPVMIAKQKKSTKKTAAIKISPASYISAGVMIFVIVAFGGFYGYNLYKQSKADNYERAAYEIQMTTNRHMAKLGPMFRQFVATPAAAKKLGPKFEEAASVTKRGTLALKTLSVPAEQKSNHLKLVKSYENATFLYNDLTGLCKYLTDRDKVIKGYVKALKGFAKDMSETKRRNEVIDIAGKAEKSIGSSLKKMKKIKSPIEIYDDKMLIKYTKTLAKHLKEFKEALSNQKTSQIKTSLDNISEDYSLNWQKAFFNADKDEIEKYNKKVKDIQTIYGSVDS